MYQAGGRITITIGGQRYSPRGKAIIKPAQLSHELMTNHDGTVSRATKAMPATAELTFDRGNQAIGTARPKWDSSFMLPFYDITIRETDTGVLHLFSGATIVGEPAIDTESGEVTGLSVGTDNYTQSK